MKKNGSPFHQLFLFYMRIKLQPDLGNLFFPSGMGPNPKLIPELLKFFINMRIIITTHLLREGTV